MIKIKNKKLVLTIACLFLLYTTWGMVYLSIRFALEGFPPVMLSGMRYVAAGSVFLIFTYVIRKDRTLPSFLDFRAMVIGGFFMIVVSGALLNMSEVYLPSGVTALLLGSTPLWMVLCGFLFTGDRKPTKSVIFGLIGGFSGIILLTVSVGLEIAGSLFGVACVMGSVFGWVSGSLYAKSHKPHVPMAKLLGFQMVTGGIMMLVISWLIGEYDVFSIANVPLKAWLSYAHLVIFGSLVGYTCYAWLLFNTPTNIASSYAYMEPIVAVFLGAMFADEHVSGFTITACALVITSVFFIMHGNSAKK